MSMVKFKGRAPKEKRPPYTGTREIVPVDVERCPRCTTEVHAQEQIEPALIRHGGYGAANRTVFLACRCGWASVTDRDEVHPRTQLSAP